MIRKIEERDFDRFLEMEQNFYESDAADTPFVKEYCIRTFQRLMDQCSNLFCYVFEEDEEVLGFALLTSYWRNEVGGFVVILDELFVEEEARGKHLGSNFLEFMMNEFQGIYKMHVLEVSQSNEKVKKLYKRFGFQEDFYEHMIQK